MVLTLFRGATSVYLDFFVKWAKDHDGDSCQVGLAGVHRERSVSLGSTSDVCHRQLRSPGISEHCSSDRPGAAVWESSGFGVLPAPEVGFLWALGLFTLVVFTLGH